MGYNLYSMLWLQVAYDTSLHEGTRVAGAAIDAQMNWIVIHSCVWLAPSFNSALDSAQPPALSQDPTHHFTSWLWV